MKGFVGLYVNLLSHWKDRRKDDRTITTRNTVSLVSIVYLYVLMEILLMHS